ncbi:hypothetical protein D3C75_502240 [compost metagenome]
MNILRFPVDAKQHQLEQLLLNHEQIHEIIAVLLVVHAGEHNIAQQLFFYMGQHLFKIILQPLHKFRMLRPAFQLGGHGVQNLENFGLIAWLQQIMLHPLGHRFACIVIFTVTGQDDILRVRRLCPELPDQVQSVHQRHADVCNHDVSRFPAEPLQRLRSVIGRLKQPEPVLLPGNQAGNPLHHQLLIINEQYFIHRRCLL